MNDEYELIPHQEILELRKEIEALKEQLKTRGQAGEPQKNLTESIQELILIFREATEQLRSKPASQESLAMLVDQNEKIAKGLLAIADILNEYLPQILRNTAGGVGKDFMVQKPAPEPESRPEPRFLRNPVRNIAGFDDSPRV